MRKLLSILILVSCCSAAQAQVNLVLNPSFESYDTCPTIINEIYYANFWSAIDSIGSPFIASAPEYANTCSSTIQGTLPNNDYFHHYPRTGNGLAYAGMYYDSTSLSSGYIGKREYTQGRLSAQLVPGKSYCVTFYVVMGNKFSCAYACNHIGAYLDNGMIDTISTHTVAGDAHYTDSLCGLPQTKYTPQIIENQIINDSVNWTKIQGSFIATGNERFITIGNFSDNAHTSTQFLLNPADTSGFYLNISLAIYLIDDVSVIESDALPNAGNDTSITQGDSTFLGPNEISLPYTWYVLGHTEAPIDSGGGMWVHPDTTTTYILQQTLCGEITYDTVTVTVLPVSVGNVSLNNISVYPNPVKDEITISNAPSGCEIKIYNIVGQEVYSTVATNSKQTFNLDLPDGSYILQIIANDGSRSVQKIVIEK